MPRTRPAATTLRTFASAMSSGAVRIERRVATLVDVARAFPGEVGARADRVRAEARAIARTYSRDEREALALLFLPFLLVASAMVVHQSVRALQSYLVAITIPDDEIAPLAPPIVRDSRMAAVPRMLIRPAAPVRTDLAVVPTEAELKAAHERVASLAEAPMPAGVKAAAAPDIQPPLDPPQIALTPAPVPDSATAQPTTTLALLAPIGRPGPTVAPRAPEPVETLEVDDNGKPIRAGICAIDQAPRTTVSAALTLGETFRPVDAEAFGLRLAKAAEAQIGDFVIYNDAYRSISYPMGDVNRLFGVCTDVVVRAYRALGLDLQTLVHEARAGRGDRSIDHRRTEVLRNFFATQGESLPVTTFAEDYRPGDIVTYYRPQNRRTRAHIAVVSSVIAPSGRPMIVHNRGWGPELEDALFVDQITGHYRYRGSAQTRNAGMGDGAATTWSEDRGTPVLPASYATEGRAHPPAPARP